MADFIFDAPTTTEIYTLSLHDALPICYRVPGKASIIPMQLFYPNRQPVPFSAMRTRKWKDRKSTRLNSSHSQISYAVFCLKKKRKIGTASSGLGILEP